MIYVDLDIESRSPLDLKKVGLAKYARSPETEVLCFVLKSKQGFIGTSVNSLDRLRLLSESNEYIFRAHNAAFEMQILEHQLGIKIPPHRWRCSMALAYYHNLPGSLDLCARMLGLDKLKDMAGKKNMMDMCKPLGKGRIQRGHGEPHSQALSTFKWDDERYHMDFERYQTLLDYCVDDVLTEEAIFDRLGELPELEQKRWEKDYIMNFENGISLDVELCKSAVKLTQEIRKDLNKQCEEKHGFKLTQVADVKNFCELPNTQAPTLEKALETTQDPEKLWVIKGRQTVGSKAADKYSSALNMEIDGKVYGTMQFMGASQTGRWSGRGLQTQNFARGHFDELWVDEQMNVACSYIKQGRVEELVELGYGTDRIDVLKSCARGMLIGNLAVADFSQIEARVIAWLAGQEDMLEAFRSGQDLYKVSASQIYGVPVSEVTKDQRFIGKIAVLALGYQGGVGAFLNMAKVYGVEDMDEEFVRDIIDKWRAKNSKIKNLWYRLQDQALEACSGYENERFKYENEFLIMKLPSGRQLHYYKPEVREGKYGNIVTFLTVPSQTDQIIEKYKDCSWARVSTYGGKLTNNLVQGTARDILANAMDKLPVESLRFTVHDEWVVEGITPERLDALMLDLPEWADGIPMGVDSFQSRRYRK